MPTLLINAVSSKAGGGLNDLAHTLPLLTESLSAQGWDLKTYVVPAGEEALRRVGYSMDLVETIPIASPVQRVTWECRTLPTIVNEGRPEVVFQFSNLIFRRLKAPQVTVLRSPTFYNAEYAARSRSGAYLTLRYYIGRRVAANTVRWAEEAFCISEAQRDDIIATVGEVGRKVRVSYLGLEAPLEAKNLRSVGKEATLERLSHPVRDKLKAAGVAKRSLVLNVAHYYEHKNLGDLLQAMRKLRETMPDAVLAMTAGLTQFRGPWTPRTRADANAARCLEQEGGLVDLGPITKSDVWPLMAAADVFAFPSSLESFGHPLLEAMSVGLPIVAADTRVHREIAGDIARYHRVGDPENLATKIGAALTEGPNPSLQQRGIEHAAQFSWERHANDLAAAIKRLGPQRDAEATPDGREGRGALTP